MRKLGCKIIYIIILLCILYIHDKTANNNKYCYMDSERKISIHTELHNSYIQKVESRRTLTFHCIYFCNTDGLHEYIVHVLSKIKKRKIICVSMYTHNFCFYHIHIFYKIQRIHRESLSLGLKEKYMNLAHIICLLPQNSVALMTENLSRAPVFQEEKDFKQNQICHRTCHHHHSCSF